MGVLHSSVTRGIGISFIGYRSRVSGQPDTTRASLLQNDNANGGKPVRQRKAINDTRGHVSELLAKCIRQRFYEGHLIDMVRRGGDPARLSAVKLGLFNVGGDDWRDNLGNRSNGTVTLASLFAESVKPTATVTAGALPDEPVAKPIR